MSRPLTPRAFRSGRQAGFSLVEMMVALVAGMIVVAAVIAFMMSSFSSNAEYVRSTRLTQELRNTLDLATRDMIPPARPHRCSTRGAAPTTTTSAPTSPARSRRADRPTTRPVA